MMTLDGVMKLMAVKAHEKGLELACHVGPDTPEGLIGDPVRLRQILINLVGNSIKFTETGEVVVDVSCAEQSETEAVLHVSVRDTGIGIPADFQERIFDSFSQADSSTTRRFGGTGLGLAISSQLVRMMGGQISVESAEGQGSFFGVTVSFGILVYPRLTYAFRNKQGKGFTFVLILGFAAGLFADLIGLHMILGAYIAGLFFEEKVADLKLIALVKDRLYAISYSFLGPIFFISLGFKITFDIAASGFLFLFTLTLAVIVGQIVSAGSMARRLGFTWAESLTVGVGMCGRAEMAFILASLGVSMGAIDNYVFSVLIFTSFLLNLATPTMVKLCVILLEREGWDREAPAGWRRRWTWPIPARRRAREPDRDPGRAGRRAPRRPRARSPDRSARSGMTAASRRTRPPRAPAAAACRRPGGSAPPAR